MQQMNAIAPGGIASMMRGMPQGMPQPKPQPAGIALSSIDEIANAQGTKTIPDGLKPLLALEQALSQVKAAQNQQMLQQQIPQGTIQDQYVSKADSIIQQAKAVAATSANQEQKKQAAVQQLMQGIAKAPGAQQMPGMAAGGIVAFQDGGLTKGYDRDYMDARRFGIDLSPYDSLEKRAEKLERVRKMREFEKYMEQNRAEIPREEPPVSPDTPEAEQQRLLGRFPAPQQAAPTAPTAPAMQAPQAMRMPPAQVTSKVPVAPGAGIAQGPAAQVVKPEAMGQGISPSPLEKTVEERATAMMGMRPETEIEAARKRYSQTMDPALQAQRAERQRAIQEREAMYRQDPARQRTQAIAEMLRGYAQPIPGGGIGQFLMNAGAAGNRYQQAQQAQARKDAFDLQKLRAEMAGIDVKSAEELFKAGEEKYKPALEAGAAGVRAGTDLITQRRIAETAAADRESRERVAAENRASQEAINKLSTDTQIKVARIMAEARGDSRNVMTPDQRANLRLRIHKEIMDDKNTNTIIYNAKEAARKAGKPFDREAFIDGMVDKLFNKTLAAGEGRTPPVAPTATTAPNPKDPLGIR